MAFLGDESQWAAEAAECAGDQGAFWAYHDKLFASQAGENQGAFAKDKLKGFAADLKLDTAAFNTCLDSGKYTQIVQTQTSAAQMLGVQSTPSFYINDWLVLGALPLTEFEKYFDKINQGKHPAPTATPLPAGVQFYDVDPNRPGMTYDGSATVGDAAAQVLILGFEDLKNTDAAAYVKDIEPALREKYIDTGKVRLMIKLYPMTAPKSAAAALCATGQGKFWEFRKALYSHQAEWQDTDAAALAGYAKSIGMDEAAYQKCVADDQTAAQVDELLAFGQQVGVPALPAFLIVNLKQASLAGDIVGATKLTDFEAKLDAALNPPTPTPAAASQATPTATK